MVLIKGRVAEQTTEGAHEQIDKLARYQCRNVSAHSPDEKGLYCKKGEKRGNTEI
jgi:hypothetical protein